MPKPDRQSASNLRLVVSSDRPLPARSAPRTAVVTLVIDERPRRQLLRTMTLVATARRFAAARLRRKVAAGRVAMLWLVVVTAAAIVLSAAGRPTAVTALLGVVGILLLFRPRADEHLNAQAAALERCATDIAALAAGLAGADARDSEAVHAMRARYGAVLKACATTHHYADYMAARQAEDEARAVSAPARLQYVFGTYGGAVATALLPFVGLLAK